MKRLIAATVLCLMAAGSAFAGVKEIKDSRDRTSYRKLTVYQVTCTNGKSYRVHQDTSDGSWTTSGSTTTHPNTSNKSIQFIADLLCN